MNVTSRQDENAYAPQQNIGRNKNGLPAKPPKFSARKALGNITNTASKQKAVVETTEKRRALGDITNSKFKEASKDPHKKNAQVKLKTDTKSAKAKVGLSSEARDNADEEDDDIVVEKLAGKSWRQQEAEREIRENEEMRRSLDAMFNPSAPWWHLGSSLVVSPKSLVSSVFP